MPPAVPPQGNSNAMMFNAMQALTQQLLRLNTYYDRVSTRDYMDKVQEDSDAQVAKVTAARVKPHITPKVDNVSDRPGGRISDDASVGTAPRTGRPDTFEERLSTYQQEVKGQGGGVRGRLRAARTTFNQPYGQTPGGVSDNASVPGTPGFGGTPVAGEGEHFGRSGNDALTFALLGEHGGPSFMRNAYMESYALQRNLGWAHNAAGGLGALPERLSGYTGPGSGAAGALGTGLAGLGVNTENMNALSNALQYATKHPVASYLGYKAVTGTFHGLAGMANKVSDWSQAGAQFGMSNQGAGGQYLFGMKNPLSPFFSSATQEGVSLGVERQALMGRIPGSNFGSGLSKGEATDLISTLASQGWMNQGGGGAGDNANIATNFMEPLLRQFTGLKPEELAQFTPLLRNSGTSIDQLRTSLENLGQSAQATHETIGAATSSLATLASTVEGSHLGSMQGGVDLGAGFTGATALDPQIVGQLIQSPMVQGMMMSRYGVLPSGIGDTNAGTVTSTSLATLQMLQRATAGLNQTKYEMRNGQRVAIQSGQTAQIDQIAQMMGMDPNIVRRMLGDQTGITRRSDLSTMLGSANDSTGIYAMLNAHHGGWNKQQTGAFNKVWDQTIAHDWQGTGISRQQMAGINKIGNPDDRAKALQAAIQKASGSDTWNQVQGGPNAQTVRVQFTGAAAKFFQQVGPTTSKQAANAGGTAINGVVNSIGGDLSAAKDVAQFIPGLGPAVNIASGAVDTLKSLIP